AGNVLRPQPPVEADRHVDRLHHSIGPVGEPPAPHCVRFAPVGRRGGVPALRAHCPLRASGLGKDMVRNFLIAVLVVVAAAAFWLLYAPRSSENRPAPALTGWMKDFTPTHGAVPAPLPAVQARGGGPVGLADFRGRHVLINFWATWCVPCVREMPSLLRLQKARGGEAFTVIALSQDLQGWPAVESFLDRHDLAG